MIYYLLMIATVIISLWAQSRVNSAYNKWSGVQNSVGMTGAQVARAILDANGLSHIKIASIAGKLTDNFNPTTNVISLSSGVYDGKTVAAIGIAAHEVGHAIQHSKGYLPIKIRASLVPVVNFGSGISWYLIMGGLLLNGFLSSACGQNDAGFTIAMIGVVLYACVTLFHLVTLPVELNASRRAKRQIEKILQPEKNEMNGVGDVLGAAAMTYVASLITSAVQLFRLFFMVNNSRNRR